MERHLVSIAIETARGRDNWRLLDILLRLDTEIGKLTKILEEIQDYLADAEDREVTERARRSLLKDLKDLAYDLDDIIDEHATYSLILDEVEDKVCCFFLQLPRRFALRFITASAMERNEGRIHEIFNRMSRLRPREGTIIDAKTTPSSWVDSNQTYGREGDKNLIMNMLLASGSGETDPCDPHVISIVGEGGLGKTALARLVYDSKRVDVHFQLKVWVSVSSRGFNVKMWIEAIIESITEETCPNLELDMLQDLLKDKINGRRYLLVLDDVSERDQKSWPKVQMVLRCGARDSRVIVTTRIDMVANIMSPTSTHKLPRLSNDDCWNIFRSRAFPDGTGEAYPSFEQIGRDIVGYCDGSPLLAKAVGSLMFSKRELYEWVYIRDREISSLFRRSTDQNSSLTSSPLKLSYYHLPPYLKQCLIYCLIYPKGYKLKKEMLIQLWAAGGFLQSSGSNDSRSPEEIGNHYFNELLGRALFQDIKKDGYGNINYCKMPNLIHELVKSIVEDECVILSLTNQLTKTSTQTRHLSLSSDDSKATFPIDILKDSSFRSLLFLQPIEVFDFDSALSRLKRLRVLTINQNQVKELPSSVCSLIHLRYLDIEYTSVSKLPKRITTLKNLQTLKLGAHFNELPEDVSCFKKLAYLGIELCHELEKMPANIGQLQFLQKLPKFIVGKEGRRGIGELHSLDLWGNIAIKSLENVKDIHEVEVANLIGKCHLQELELVWSEDILRDSDTSKIESIEKVLEGLQPHPNLQRLSITNYGGVRFPNWLMSSSLQNITHVKLDGCERCELVPPFKNLPKCESLELHKMCKVKNLDLTCHKGSGREGGPLLKRLILLDMPCLELFLPSVNEIYGMPCLEVLTIGRCPSLKSLPSRLSVGHLTLMDSNSAVLSSIAGLSSLRKLRIDGFPDVRFLHEGMLQSHGSTLESLDMNDFHSLKSLSPELKNLSSLKSLRINAFHSLTTLSSVIMEGFCSLQELSIQDCKQLACLPSKMQSLTSLKKLTIAKLPKLTNLPEDVQYLANLEELTVEGCNKFTVLPEWLGNLTKLRVLNVRNFSCIQSLPMSLVNTTTLKVLNIRNCPHLQSRYKESSPEDWHIVSHISHIKIC